MPDDKPKQEHPLANILINVIIPSVVLGILSKDPALQKVPRPWHIGPLWGMLVAVAIPLCYGIWYFIRSRKFNPFSALGLVGVALSGLIALYLWNADGTVKPNAGLYVGTSEALIPLILGLAILWSRKSGTPLIRVFLYNDTIFDVPKIEKAVAERSEILSYDSLLTTANRLFACSFFLSAVMNIAMALWFFRAFDEKAVGAREVYTGIVGTMRWAGFIAIGLPLMGILFLVLTRLLKGLRELTGLKDEELMMPR